MRILPCCALLLVFCAVPAAAQVRAAPIPPGDVQAARVENAPLEPPRFSSRKGITPQQLQQEVQALGKLASTVQVQVLGVAKGEMAKDLPNNLKELEKLVKQIRLQVSR